MRGDKPAQVIGTMGNSHHKSVDLETPPSPKHLIISNGNDLANGDKTLQNGTMRSENNDTAPQNCPLISENNHTKPQIPVLNEFVMHSKGDTVKLPVDAAPSITPNPEISIPFPKRMHCTLEGPEIEKRPFVVIGDVHGCLDELQELIAEVRNKEPECLFIFAGDIINKGPKSLETLRYVRNMGSNAYSVRGNHEDHTLDRWLRWKREPEYVPKKKFHWCSGLSLEEAEWIQELPYTISIPHLNSVIVHAGFVPGRPLNEQLPWDMTEMRDMVGNTPSKLREGIAWASLWTGPQHVYFGHDARRRLQQEKFATGLDTGCVFGGQLTAHFLTGDKSMVRVDAKYAYKKHKKNGASVEGDASD